MSEVTEFVLVSSVHFKPVINTVLMSLFLTWTFICSLCGLKSVNAIVKIEARVRRSPSLSRKPATVLKNELLHRHFFKTSSKKSAFKNCFRRQILQRFNYKYFTEVLNKTTTNHVRTLNSDIQPNNYNSNQFKLNIIQNWILKMIHFETTTQRNLVHKVGWRVPAWRISLTHSSARLFYNTCKV